MLDAPTKQVLRWTDINLPENAATALDPTLSGETLVDDSVLFLLFMPDSETWQLYAHRENKQIQNERRLSLTCLRGRCEINHNPRDCKTVARFVALKDRDKRF